VQTFGSALPKGSAIPSGSSRKPPHLSTDFALGSSVRRGVTSKVAGMKSNLGYLLRSNRGFFSRAEAVDSGETDRTLATARREGLIVRLRRGMYAPADLYNVSDDAGRHLLHARAALAAQRGSAALTGPSAAALHGFALYQEDLAIVHLLRLDRGCSHHAAKINHHVVTQDIEDDLGVYDGITAISPARAVWEVACRSSLESGVVTADSALHQDPRLGAALEESQQRFAYFPGSRRGRLAIKLADPRAESPGESVTRVSVPSIWHPYARAAVSRDRQSWRAGGNLGLVLGAAAAPRGVRRQDQVSEASPPR
jgi:Transcriptional regulator, AbiEi antitoxin